MIKRPKVLHEVAATIDEFVTFCNLLRKPENHILVRSGQYIEKQVPSRQESDMVQEMARELVNIPKYEAFAKVVEERELFSFGVAV